MREFRSSGSVRDEVGNSLVYSDACSADLWGVGPIKSISYIFFGAELRKSG